MYFEHRHKPILVSDCVFAYANKRSVMNVPAGCLNLQAIIYKLLTMCPRSQANHSSSPACHDCQIFKRVPILNNLHLQPV